MNRRVAIGFLLLVIGAAPVLAAAPFEQGGLQELFDRAKAEIKAGDEVLGTLEEEKPLPQLTKALTHYRNARAILSQVPENLSQQQSQALDKQIRHANEKVQGLISKCSGFPGKDMVKFLGGLFANEKLPLNQISLFEALEKIGGEEALKAMVVQGLPVTLPMIFMLIEPTLRRMDDADEIRWWTRKALGTDAAKKPVVRRLLFRIIASLDSPSVTRVFRAELRSKDPEYLVEVLGAIRRRKSKGLGKDVLRTLRTPNDDVQVAALLAIEAMDANGFRRDLRKFLKSRFWKTRTLVVDILGRLGSEDKALGPMLDDRHTRVRTAAVEALLRHLNRKVVDLFIGRLKKEESLRVKDDLADALLRLTGRDLVEVQPDLKL